MRKIFMSIAILLTMNSCGVYTTYQPSESIVSDSLYRESVSQDTASLASLSWRELFVDRQLQLLIERGLESNTDLRIARLRVEAAEATLMNARLSYLPSVSLDPEGAIGQHNGSSVTTFNLGASANWEIDIFGKVSNAKRGARAVLESSKAYEQAVQTQLVATIANSYYTLLMFDKRLAITGNTIDKWAQTVKILEALKQAGRSNDVDILQANVNRMALEASILSIRKNIHEMENSLSAMLAMSPQTIERGTLAGQLFPEELAVGVPMQLLGNRPDVRQAEQNLAQAFYATNAARSAFYPNITLSGIAGWTNSGGAIQNPHNWLLNAIGSLMQPLFNRGANIANLKVAKAQQEEATLLFQQSILNAGKEVNDALTKWQTVQKRIDIGIQQIETLQEALLKTELLMQHSSITYLEVLTAQQSLLDAELVQTQDYFDKIQCIINLYHALGGGVE